VSSFRKSIQAYRTAAGSTAGGYVTPGTETSFTIRASVQPTKPTDLELLPEGRREARTFRLYTNDTLQVLNGEETKGDQVVLFGDRYETLAEMPWQNNVINHNKYIVGKIG